VVNLAAALRPNPLSLVAAILIFGGIFALLGDRDPARSDPLPPCDVADAGCGGAVVSGASSGAPTLTAEEACLNAGYLCADLARADRIQIRRWTNFEGTLVVHVPRPDFEDAGVARDMQRAATMGIRAWNGQPFPVLVDTRGDRNPHFSVRWSRSLGGAQIGAARTQWTPQTGLTVVSLELTTRHPFGQNRVNATDQVRLTAAHEMGHALGLPHSDSDRDVMYPTNTATSVTAEDRRTMEALYQLADGTEIVR
jgi:predicted Zn-dependent protease